MNKNYFVTESDVNIIHNIPQYKLEDQFNYTLLRKVCTLQRSASNLLSFINLKNFLVNYTVVPYTGVSMLDIRFKVRKIPKLNNFLSEFKKATIEGKLRGLYYIDKVDSGANAYICTEYSAVFIQDNVKILGDNIYLHGYFDNENSVNRYFDLVQYLAVVDE
mgnify:CR=1 FL=1